MEASTSPSPAELARRAFRRVFDDRDLADPYAIWSDGTVNHFLATGEDVRGAQDLAAWFGRLFDAVPDFAITIEDVVEDAGRRIAVVRWTGSGTLTGAPFQGVEPNGRRAVIRGVDVIHYDADGKVAENTVYYDSGEFARGVGLLPARGSRAERALLRAFNARTRLGRRLGRRSSVIEPA